MRRLTSIIIASAMESLTADSMAGQVYTFAGSQSTSPGLLAYDANTFSPVGGTPQSSVGFLNDLAFDEAGRLFGIGNGPGPSLNSFYEFDPLTLAIINQVTRPSDVGGAGLAASATAPEPDSVALLVLGAAVLALNRRPRRAVGNSV